jgi:hypothetical protein
MWLVLVFMLNLAVICVAFVRARGIWNGFLEATDLYNLFNIGTYAINAVLIAPAAIAYGWAEKISDPVPGPSAP